LPTPRVEVTALITPASDYGHQLEHALKYIDTRSGLVISKSSSSYDFELRPRTPNHLQDGYGCNKRKIKQDLGEF